MTLDDVTGGRTSSSKLVAFVVLLAVAVAGGAAGVLIDRTVLLDHGRRGDGPPRGENSRGRGRSPSPEMRRRFSDRMAEELKLTKEQQVKVDSIMTRQFRGMEAASASIRPTIDSLVRAAQASMDSVLNAEQRERVKTLRRSRGDGRSGDGRGGGGRNGDGRGDGRGR